MTLPDIGSIARLEHDGFEGFRTVAQLHADQCVEIPNARGIYAIARASLDAPRFLARSSAAAYRGMDPTLPPELLAARWVAGAQLLFLGDAPGRGVRALLRQRVKRLLRFGHGRVVGHWDGRALWQLADRTQLLVAWKPIADDPAPPEQAYLDDFRRRFGALPFANQEFDARD